MKAHIWKAMAHPLNRSRVPEWHWAVVSPGDRSGPVLQDKAASWQDALAAVQRAGHLLTGRWL
jgi:hypothetical protein